MRLGCKIEENGLQRVVFRQVASGEQCATVVYPEDVVAS